MYQRLWLVILFGLLAFGSASAQESGVLSEPTRASNPARPDIKAANSFRLKGVLISESGRTALINGRPVQQGDSVGGAEILSIEQRRIRVLVGSRELSVDVGGSFAGTSTSRKMANASRDAVRERRGQEQLTTMRSTPPLNESVRPVDAPLRHAVKAGETLSGIALHYRTDDVTLDQMMIALFQSNPDAFRSNINLLRAGAVLHIPGRHELRPPTPAMAAAEVARHADRWRSADLAPVTVADSSRAGLYGPVENGETLSAIASQLLHDDVTMDQLMIAIYQSNPQAFSHNINVLHRGAVLRIPADDELRLQTPEMAAAEVLRQTKAWQTGFEQNALSTPSDTNIMAAVDIPIDKLR